LVAVHTAFNDVIWIVCGLGLVVALFTLFSSGKTWSEYGKHALLLERDIAATERSGSGSAAALRERDEEIRQMLEASNARRARRGEAPLDVEAELRRLTAPSIDAALAQEIRDMVLARNYRRARRGEAPLDVEAEVAREIAQLTTL
jgi:hypothetical protein